MRYLFIRTHFSWQKIVQKQFFTFGRLCMIGWEMLIQHLKQIFVDVLSYSCMKRTQLFHLQIFRKLFLAFDYHYTSKKFLLTTKKHHYLFWQGLGKKSEKVIFSFWIGTLQDVRKFLNPNSWLKLK